jgi:hypothetical protein
LPFDKAILEALTSLGRPWDDLHHRYFFLLELRRIEAGEFVLTMTGDRSCPINPLAMHTIYGKGNMETITETISIDISRTHVVVENVFIGADFSPEKILIYTNLFKEFCDVFSWYYEEMPVIDPRIVKHEITNYPNSKPFEHKLRLVNPRKAEAIKDKLEKLLKYGFIYLIQLTQWVSNPVPVIRRIF